MLKLICPFLLELLCSTMLYGQNTADTTAQLFEPGLISTKYPNRDIAISTDGNEVFYTLQSYKREVSVIMRLVKVKGKWSKPQVASFSGQHGDLEPAFSPDGKRLYFVSNRSANGTTKEDYDIWYVDKTNDKWGDPINIGTPVNTEENEFYPSITSKGDLYFTAEYEDNKGKEDIYVSRLVNGKYTNPESISEAVNSKTYEFNAFIVPDESYILFTSYGRPDDLGGGDLYISSKNDQGEWSPARHLSHSVNSTALDYCPFVSADSKYLYFTSDRSSVTSARDYKSIINMMESIENGFDNVYRISWDKILSE
ncbi:PD40 domain-containing protein [Fulvivirga sp. 29W222]|uniref:PD40 domain-containing protein n=1 Tax=Fulvivirga marina TaxID=2494733 RepID=A0A937FZQ1_9BACT|nr:PD40 domain-containing protein [Fulvivirga marina]MBL6447982.1 PD40 domain-containing protein [Fulvivirga marina]